MKMMKLTPEMKLRRWNRVLLAKCVRIGDLETAEWFQNQIPQDSTPPVNIRAFAKVYWKYRKEAREWMNMDLQMDGSGECSQLILANFERGMVTRTNQMCLVFNTSLEEVELEIISIIEKIHKIHKSYLPHNPLFTLYAERQNWRSLLGDVVACETFEKIES